MYDRNAAALLSTAIQGFLYDERKNGFFPTFFTNYSDVCCFSVVSFSCERDMDSVTESMWQLQPSIVPYCTIEDFTGGEIRKAELIGEGLFER